MKEIEILHAHNHGHKNVGDDAMANNVYRKLTKKSDNVWTISTYSPPINADIARDIKSLSSIINNYDNLIIKIILVGISRLKLKLFYAIYAFVLCELIYSIALLHSKFHFPLLAFGKVRRMIWALSESKTYIRSGSGSLNDIWFWSSMYPQYTEARIAKLNGAKVYFVGQGIGPLTTKFRLQILKRFAESCDFITLRDPERSANLLYASHPITKNWEVVGDDAIDYPKEEAPKVISDLLINKQYVICQFRPTDYEKTLNDKYWEKLAITLQKIKKENDRLMFLAISFSTGRVNDLEPAKKINSAIGEKLLEIVEYELSPGQAKSLFENAQFSIGQSYHFGVFSLAENTAFIGLYSNDYYHDKLNGLLEWYGHENYAINFDQLDTMPSKVQEIIQNSQVIKQKLKARNDVMIEKVNSIYTKI